MNTFNEKSDYEFLFLNLLIKNSYYALNDLDIKTNSLMDQIYLQLIQEYHKNYDIQNLFFVYQITGSQGWSTTNNKENIDLDKNIVLNFLEYFLIKEHLFTKNNNKGSSLKKSIELIKSLGLKIENLNNILKITNGDLDFLLSDLINQQNYTITYADFRCIKFPLNQNIIDLLSKQVLEEKSLNIISKKSVKSNDMNSLNFLKSKNFDFTKEFISKKNEPFNLLLLANSNQVLDFLFENGLELKNEHKLNNLDFFDIFFNNVINHHKFNKDNKRLGLNELNYQKLVNSDLFKQKTEKVDWSFNLVKLKKDHAVNIINFIYPKIKLYNMKSHEVRQDIKVLVKKNSLKNLELI